MTFFEWKWPEEIVEIVIIKVLYLQKGCQVSSFEMVMRKIKFSSQKVRWKLFEIIIKNIKFP